MSLRWPRPKTRGVHVRRGRHLSWGARTYVMGIVNASPDSFSGDGQVDAGGALRIAEQHLEDGADLLDIGGESTRPGHAPIDESLERRRLLPAVSAIRQRFPDALLSIDTFKPSIFRAAHAAGGDVLNAIWGADEPLLETAAECGAPVILMHNKRVAVYERSVVDEVLFSLERDATAAVRAGIPADHVMLDPGIGFGKTPDDNLAVLAALPRVVALGFPTVLGTSRKSTIGKLTGQDVSHRTFGTAATVALAAAAGIDIVRVHDVAPMRDVVRVADGIVRGWRPEGWDEPP